MVVLAGTVLPRTLPHGVKSCTLTCWALVFVTRLTLPKWSACRYTSQFVLLVVARSATTLPPKLYRKWLVSLAAASFSSAASRVAGSGDPRTFNLLPIPARSPTYGAGGAGFGAGHSRTVPS